MNEYSTAKINSEVLRISRILEGMFPGYERWSVSYAQTTMWSEVISHNSYHDAKGSLYRDG